MSRLIKLALFAIALWASVELYTNGVQGAFGGVLAEKGGEVETVTRTKHAAGAFQRAYDSSEARADRGLEAAAR